MLELECKMNCGFFETFHIRITETCHQKGVKLRSAGHGLWLCSLLPAALICNFSEFNRYSELYKITSIVSIGQFVCAVCHIFNYGFDRIPFVPIGLLFSSTIVSLLLIFCSNQGLTFVLSIAVLPSVGYFKFFEILLNNCPRSFTYGEATLFSQATILFLSSLWSNIFLFWFESFLNQNGDISPFILQLGFLATLVLLIAAFQFPDKMKNLSIFLAVLFLSAAVCIFVVPLVVIKENSLNWFLQLINNEKSYTLVAVWMICCSAAVYCLFQHCAEAKSASSAMRKSFHFLIFIVILSGCIMHPCLVYIASGVALVLLIIIETIRKLKITTHASALQACFELFKDEKDEGDLALTPLYLMVGCVLPMWLYPFSYSHVIPVPVVAGLSTVAIGDAMASIGGSWFGRHRWPKSLKTIEGSCCCFLSQIIVLFLLHYIGFIRLTSFPLWSSAVALITVIEAQTDQIDNVVLPLISYILFCIIS